MRRIVLSALLAALVVGAAGCTRGGEPQAGPSTPTPAPTPTVGPVDGEGTVVVVTADNSSLVFNDRTTPEPDQAAIDAFAAQVEGWLDEHLTDLQDGEEGGLEDVAAAGLLDGADPATLDAVTSDLTSPDAPVDDARYHLVVAHSGQPLWLRAHVVVVDRDGAAREAGFVFTPTEDGDPELVALGPGPLGGSS